MPIKTIKNLTDHLTEHIVTGDITDKEMFDCEKEFYESDPTKFQLWDMSMAKLTNVTIDGMRQFIARSNHCLFHSACSGIAPKLLTGLKANPVPYNL
jgi:hypothetical protein